jgi:hypothetical protein
MTELQRGFFCALAAPSLLFGACRAQPELARRLNLDVWALPELEGQIEQGERLRARDDEAECATHARMEARQRVADEVIAGRVGLLEAASRFHDLNQADPDALRTLGYAYRAAPDDELCCRQVISWVESRLMDTSAGEAASVRARLEEDLGKYLRRGGTIQ